MNIFKVFQRSEAHGIRRLVIDLVGVFACCKHHLDTRPPRFTSSPQLIDLCACVQVLGTDMAKHFEDVGKLATKVTALTAGATNPADVIVSPKARRKVCNDVML